MEQILASHSEVYGAGEQEGMLSLAARLPFVLREPQATPTASMRCRRTSCALGAELF